MQKKKLNNKGFGLVGVLVVILVLVAAGGAGYYIWHKNHKAKVTTTSSVTTDSTSKKLAQSTTTPQPVDPYAGWKTYSTGQVSFRYPSSWVVSEGPTNSPDSATKQEYAINIKRDDNVKYNDTASLEILGQDLKTTEAWYDDYYAQSPLNKVMKSEAALKGKPAVAYQVLNSGIESKLYLLGVGSKVYSFRSVNESSNIQVNADYWTLFSKVFESLQIN